MKSFITVANGIITGRHHGDINIDLPAYSGQQKIEVPYGAAIRVGEAVSYYTDDWHRKSACCLIDEGLIAMPQGFIREGDQLRPMTQVERIEAGLESAPLGQKIVDGELVQMTTAEMLAAGQITQDEYNQRIGAENQAELNRRLEELQTPECVAQAEIDEWYATERKSKLAALLSVKKQSGWPVTVDWTV